MQIHCKPGGLQEKDHKTESGFSPKTMQIHATILKTSWFGEDQDLKTEPWVWPESNANTCKDTVNQAVWRIKISKLNLGVVPKSCKYMVPRSCKYTVNQVVWRIRITKLNLDLVPKSCKYMQIYCKPAGLDDQDPKTESRFSLKIMQIHCKPGGLEDKDPKTESGFSDKIIQKQQNYGNANRLC